MTPSETLPAANIPKGYERIDFLDVGHFPNAKSPTT